MALQVREHQQVHTQLERTLARGRLASTYLFVGPPGVGKRTFAFKLAAAVLCPENAARSLEACGTCESCRLLSAGNHPDLLSVSLPEGKSSLPISLFLGEGDKRNREGLCHYIALKPYLGERRVAIIDDADALGIESANCLLKTLEEPPPRSLIVLVGTSLSKQLPTIRSRCQVMRFGPLSDQAVQQVLEENALLEEGENAHTLASLSGGSVAAALAARDQQAEAFRQAFATDVQRADFDPVRAAKEVTAHVTAAGSEASARRLRLVGLIGAAAESFRQQLLTSPAGPSAEAALCALDACLEAETAVSRNANQATLIQAWLIRIRRAHLHQP